MTVSACLSIAPLPVTSKSLKLVVSLQILGEDIAGSPCVVTDQRVKVISLNTENI